MAVERAEIVKIEFIEFTKTVWIHQNSLFHVWLLVAWGLNCTGTYQHQMTRSPELNTSVFDWYSIHE